LGKAIDSKLEINWMKSVPDLNFVIENPLETFHRRYSILTTHTASELLKLFKTLAGSWPIRTVICEVCMYISSEGP
jgi:hypothetical protein